jgi:hypothetical protein
MTASSWDAPAGLAILFGIKPTALPWAGRKLPLRGENVRVILDEGFDSTNEGNLSRPAGQSRSVMDAAEQ